MTNTDTGEAAVVAGVDGSESALRAVRWAAHEAVRRGAPLRLVHVCYLVPVRHPRQVAPPPEYRDALLGQGRHWLIEAEEAARHAEPGLVVSTDLREGVTSEVLVRESRTARLVVLGSRGLGGFAAMLLGSVSVALTAHGHCPVVVVRSVPDGGTAPETGPVLVGVDGSELSQAAVAFAFEAAAARGVPLVALHTWFDVDVSGAWAVFPATIDWDYLQKQAEQALTESMAPWRAKFPDVEVREVVERERPERALLRHGAGASLIVVGSRGRGAFTGLGLGSVSQAVLHHAGCPVVVARTEKG
ncbi:universal stress protein [Actinophytocola sp. NPDC049390]|uniref:universal stress protein n=1 Tax=Actinophytocola sp. NPDC049390 TaxID=3363894 RepID=UPI00378F182F